MKYKNKKMVYVLLMIVLAILFTACGREVSNSNTDKKSTSTTITTPVNTEEPATETEEEITSEEIFTEETSQEVTETDATVITVMTTENLTEEIKTATAVTVTTPVVTTPKPTATKAPTTKATVTKEPTKIVTTAKVTTAKVTTVAPTATKAIKQIKDDPIMPAVDLSSKVPAKFKSVYTALLNALENKENKVVFNADNISGFGEGIKDLIPDTIEYLKEYNQQLFYVDWGAGYSVGWKTSGGEYKEITVLVAFKAAYIKGDVIDKAKIESDKLLIDNKVNTIVTEANKKANLFERELYIHDYLVNNIVYNKTTVRCGDIYGALIEGKAKCEGYSRAFQYLLHKVGIETYIISGNINDGKEEHVWNMIKLYGQYYFVDVTFDDPVRSDGQQVLRHNYFNITTSVISKDHSIYAKGSRYKGKVDGQLMNMDLQTCTATEYSYTNVKG